MIHILAAAATAWTVAEIAATVTAVAGSVTACAVTIKTIMEAREASKDNDE